MKRPQLIAAIVGTCVPVLSALAQPGANDVTLDETRRQLGSRLLQEVFGWVGTGLKLGQVEVGVAAGHVDINLPNANIEPNQAAPYPLTSDLANRTQHATNVAGIMVSTNASGNAFGSGMAPGATLFGGGLGNNPIPSGNGGEAGFNSEQWVVSQGVKVVNRSNGNNTVAPNGTDPRAMAIDWLVSQNNYLHVNSAGNSGAAVVDVPADALNAISVGAIERDGGAANPLGPVALSNNRRAGYSSFGTGTTWNKPDIVAPGTNIYSADNSNPNGGGVFTGYTGGATVTGTSFAAPHVSGLAAQLYQFDLNSNHNVMRAALINTADHTVRHNDGAPWDGSNAGGGQQGLDPELGAGQVEGWGAAAARMGGVGERVGVTSGTLNAGAGTDVLTLPVGVDSRVVATVVWDRNITSNAANPYNTRFTIDANQPAIDLRFNGPAGVNVLGGGGTVKHINAVTGSAGNYTIHLDNTGAAAGNYAVSWAVSPPDVNPGTQEVYFTVRDQVHVRNGADRILEGRAGTAVLGAATADATGAAAGVESSIYKSTMNVGNGIYKKGNVSLGLSEVAGVGVPDDGVADISFGRDNIQDLTSNGGQIFFSVDRYAHALSPIGVDNPDNAVYRESTVVHEAGGDIFKSHQLLPGTGPITNKNKGVKNTPNNDFLHPAASINDNTSHADSYYMGLTGPRVADYEDDLCGLEGLGPTTFNPNVSIIKAGYHFFSLQRGSPSGHTADILVARDDMPNVFQVFAPAGMLGLNVTDHVDGLCLQVLSSLDAQGWPHYNPSIDLILFSVDRDSRGVPGSWVRNESDQGEVAGDIFWGAATVGNLLYLEGTDLGLQEFAFGNNYNWLTDNLDAIDIPDVIPGPSSLTLLVLGGVAFGRRRRG